MVPWAKDIFAEEDEMYYPDAAEDLPTILEEDDSPLWAWICLIFWNMRTIYDVCNKRLRELRVEKGYLAQVLVIIPDLNNRVE